MSTVPKCPHTGLAIPECCCKPCLQRLYETATELRKEQQ